MKNIIFFLIISESLFGQVDYSTQIQPIFDDNCISCHIDGGAYFGGLDLSSYLLAMEGGSSGNTIVPFDHSSSELFNRITLDESDYEFMPQNGTSLSQSEIDLIAQWIDEGALQENNNSYLIEGRWLWGYGGFTLTPSTMYEFLDGLRYTYYCSEDNGCDSTYWNSLDTSDAIPNPDLYTFINDTLTIDGNSGVFVDFECDGNIILSGNDIAMWRVGLDTSECEGLQLELPSSHLFPKSFKVHQNYPNPFNPFTTIRYDLPKDEFVSITIFDLLGNVINNLVNTNQLSGYKSVQWNATNNQGQPVPAGVYFYSIQAGEFRLTKKMILLK